MVIGVGLLVVLTAVLAKDIGQSFRFLAPEKHSELLIYKSRSSELE